MSIGDILAQAMGGPNPAPQPAPQMQPFRGPPEITPGTPSLPPGGVPPPAMGSQPAAAPMPPAQVYAPDPTVGGMIQQLMQMHAQDRRANAIDRGMAMMAGSFGPVATRGAIMSSAQPEDDRIRAMGGAITDASALMQIQQQQRMADAISSGALSGGVVAGAAPGGTPGGAVPAAGAGAAPAAPPLLTPAEASALRLMTIPQQQEFIQRKLQAGVDVQKTGQETQAKGIAEFKDNAIEDFSPLNQKLTESEGLVDQLLKNPTATMTALQSPDILTTSKAASWLGDIGLGPSQEAKQAAVAIQKLEAELTGESLSNVKNVRNRTEFQTLGESLTAGLNPNNGPAGVQTALEQIKQRMATAHAQVYATAGKEIPNQYAGLADPSYTTPGHPYYTGATYQAAPDPTRIQSPGDIAKLARGTPFIIPSGPNAGKTGYAQ